MALPFVPHDVDPSEARVVTLAELALADYRFDRFRSRPDEATKVDGIQIVRLEGESEAAARRDARAGAPRRRAGAAGARPRQPARQRPHAEHVRRRDRGDVQGHAGAGHDDGRQGAGEGRSAGHRRGRQGLGRGAAAGAPGVPREEAARRAVVLVGKGVTFDAGGISLKPAADMARHEARHVPARRRWWRRCGRWPRDAPPLKVVGLVPLVENMPSGQRAQARRHRHARQRRHRRGRQHRCRGATDPGRRDGIRGALQPRRDGRPGDAHRRLQDRAGRRARRDVRQRRRAGGAARSARPAHRRPRLAAAAAARLQGAAAQRVGGPQELGRAARARCRHRPRSCSTSFPTGCAGLTSTSPASRTQRRATTACRPAPTGSACACCWR